MEEVLKNLFRRKARTILTVGGITIGIFAFVVMGSMAEKISLLVSGGTRYYADKVTVSAGGSSLTSLPTPMNTSKLKEVASAPGVAAVSGSAYTSLSDDSTAVSLGPPPAIIGSDFKGDKYETFKIDYSSGRALTARDIGSVVVGADLVKKLNAKVGGNVMVRGHAYKVVGIMDKTLTAPDNEVWMTLPDSQKILYSTLPEIIKATSRPSQIINGITVYPKPGVNPDTLAKTIESQVADVEANGPKAFKDQIASATGILNAILFSIALISLVVGGLSIINTMTMSISERVREIGIKKAVGAKTRHIMKEYLSEAGMIGLLGGISGLALGSATVVLVNRAMQSSANIIFELTGRIAVISIVFAVVLGVLAGIYPAYRAVRINIVRALREG